MMSRIWRFLLSYVSRTDDKTDDSPPPKDDKVDICTATTQDLENIDLPHYLAEKIVQNKFKTFKEIRKFILKDGEEQFQKIKDNCKLSLDPNSKDIIFHSESLLNIMHKSTPSNCDVEFDKNYSQLPQSDDQLLLLHVNTDGLDFNKTKMETFGERPDVICLTKVNKNNNVAIDGYKLKAFTEPTRKAPKKDNHKTDQTEKALNKDNHETDQTEKSNDKKLLSIGRAAIYLKKNSKKFEFIKKELYSNTDEEEKLDTVYESAWVKLEGKTKKLKHKKIIIGAIYRRSQNNMTNNSLEPFRKYLHETLKGMETDDSLVYILGDFNIDLINEEKLKTAKPFYDSICSELGYKLLISEPTHQSYPSTLIDHIYTNDGDENIRSGVLYNSSFSHHPVYCVV